MTSPTEQPWDDLEALLSATPEPGKIRAFIAGLASGEAPRLLSRLPGPAQERLLAVLGPEAVADLFDQVPDAQATRLLETMQPSDAAAVLQELPSDEQADLIASLSDADAASILAEMDPEEARGARQLAEYPEDVAGGLMVTEYLAYPESCTVAEVVGDLRGRSDEIEDYEIQYAYVVNTEGRLVGVLRLRDLLFARGERTIGSKMIREPISVPASMPLDELSEFFDRHAFLGVPVLDDAGRLCGVVHRAAVEAAWGDRSESDHLKRQGIVGGDEFRSMPLLLRSRRRLSWLSVNILLNVIAASVIAAYQDTLSSVIALAVFLPIISDMSGCSGNQAVAVSMRELSLGLVKTVDVVYVWLKEVSVGVVNGIVLGLLLGGVAWLWKANGYLGVVVGVALAVNTVVAVSIGGLVPLVLKRLGRDPALASGPILTTVTDMCGFLLVLSLATALLPHLLPG